jgi:hypothetical protein
VLLRGSAVATISARSCLMSSHPSLQPSAPAIAIVREPGERPLLLPMSARCYKIGLSMVQRLAGRPLLPAAMALLQAFTSSSTVSSQFCYNLSPALPCCKPASDAAAICRGHCFNEWSACQAGGDMLSAKQQGVGWWH